jgi:hypothetical protein
MGIFYTPKPEPKRWEYKTTYIQTAPAPTYAPPFEGTDPYYPNPVNEHLNDLGYIGWEIIQIVDDPGISRTGHPLKMAYLKRELL